MKKSAIILSLLLGVRQAAAVCPLCTIAVGSGVGLLRAWGVDDIITGVWLGALVVSSILWLLDYLKKKNKSFNRQGLIITAAFYGFFIAPLYLFNIFEPQRLWLIDRLGFGIIIGSLLFLCSVWSDGYLRKINEGKVAIKYQKVIIPLVFLIVASVIAYQIIRLAG